MSEKGTISINARKYNARYQEVALFRQGYISCARLYPTAATRSAKYKLLALNGRSAPRATTTYRVDVVADKDAGTLTFTDNGIGMTAEEVEKYICAGGVLRRGGIPEKV